MYVCMYVCMYYRLICTAVSHQRSARVFASNKLFNILPTTESTALETVLLHLAKCHCGVLATIIIRFPLFELLILLNTSFYMGVTCGPLPQDKKTVGTWEQSVEKNVLP
jgi:hypothetical protein